MFERFIMGFVNMSIGLPNLIGIGSSMMNQ